MNNEVERASPVIFTEIFFSRIRPESKSVHIAIPGEAEHTFHRIGKIKIQH